MRNQLEPLHSQPTPSYTNPTRHGGTDLPPELFRYICQGAGGRSTSFRLVCKYWEQQCRPFVFAEITVQRSPQRVLDLMDLIKDPACRILPHVKTIGWIPFYTTMSEFPFLHLLGQTSIPSRVVTVEGPFRKGHRTMRSIHFAVPRTLPSCFSRGITSLDLTHIHFQRPEDLMSLVSELPDLEEVSCGRMWGNMTVTFGSDPTERLPRRPRKSRNNLKHVRITKTPAEDDKELRPGYARFALYPFMAVYDSASFFDDNQVAVICALLLLEKFDDRYDMYLDGNYEYDAETNSRLFQFGTSSSLFACTLRVLTSYIYRTDRQTFCSFWHRICPPDTARFYNHLLQHDRTNCRHSRLEASRSCMQEPVAAPAICGWCARP